MKIYVFIIGIFILLLLAYGVLCGNIFYSIATILWLPVILFLDIPILILPIVVLLMIILSVYGIFTKTYQKFYNWFRNLFIIMAVSLLLLEIEYLFRETSFFKIREYILFFSFFFSILAAIAFTAFVETKKDAKYYIIASAFILICLLVKFICFVK